MANLSPLDYESMQEVSGKIAGLSISFFSKPGLPSWSQISASTHLLAENIKPIWEDKILVLGSGHGALAATLGKQVDVNHLTVMDIDQLALNCTERTLHANGVHQFNICSSISLLPQSAVTFSCIALDIPKGRKLMRRWLTEAYYLLLPKGNLYLSGANDQGIQSAIKDAQELFGNAVTIAYKKGNRCALVRKEKPSSELPEWAYSPGIAPATWTTFDIVLVGKTLTVYSLPGIFSYDHLDEGTALLIDSISVPEHANVLDIGCGYGIIGLFAAFQEPTSNIDLIDSNLLAVAATQKNISSNQVPNAWAKPGDLLDIVQGKSYHLILSNPPFHTGKEVNYTVTTSLLQQSHQALVSGGQLILVANRFIRYDLLMKDIFGNVKILAQNNRYHVLSATK